MPEHQSTELKVKSAVLQKTADFVPQCRRFGVREVVGNAVDARKLEEIIRATASEFATSETVSPVETNQVIVDVLTTTWRYDEERIVRDVRRWILSRTMTKEVRHLWNQWEPFCRSMVPPL